VHTSLDEHIDEDDKQKHKEYSHHTLQLLELHPDRIQFLVQMLPGLLLSLSYGLHLIVKVVNALGVGFEE